MSYGFLGKGIMKKQKTKTETFVSLPTKGASDVGFVTLQFYKFYQIASCYYTH